ncbi:DNA polymerase III subunit chi [Jannaschia sp. LMIT008]|uniref:DNA polymerase III subunit chi n=1 Tax=Jannaschia maritima TaxID=3032585 RepID=UPI002810D4C5|nr:DNA polymerase III subunit chi [Jannaschia sp. LMIT008]
MPAEVYFYHLTRRSVAEGLAMLLDRALAQGWRVAVRGRDLARLERLDADLWGGPPDAFLPHGLAGGTHDDRQPVLLTTAATATGRDCVMTIDGADLDAGELSDLRRACIVFDGMDDDAVQHARGQWAALKRAGIGARYWSEESGKWAQKATANVD